MKFYRIRGLRCEKFRRLTGVSRELFDRMVEIMKEAESLRRRRGGQPHKLSMENILLMTLEYLREYRTYFHISKSYNVSESTAYKCIKWV
jgi:transposase